MPTTAADPIPKRDEHKAPLAELPWQALHGVAQAIAAGRREHGYPPHNWRRCRLSALALASATLRHLSSWLGGVELDGNGTPHLAAAAFNLLALYELHMDGVLIDDRAPRPEDA
jgi:hypothetical protein